MSWRRGADRYGDVIPGSADGSLRDGAGEAYVAAGHMDVDGWDERYIGKGIWELRPHIDDTYHNKIPMTGAAVEVTAHIPINFRLVRFEWKHLTAALVDGTDATEAMLIRDDNIPIPNLRWRLYYEAASVSSTTIVAFGEGYEYYRADFILRFNTTTTDWIAPILVLQELKP